MATTKTAAAKKTASKKTAPNKTAGKKAAPAKATTKKATAEKTASRRRAGKKPEPKKLAATKAPAERPLPTTFEHLRARVAELVRLDPGRRIFSAKSHGYELRPSVSATELAKIEKRIGVRLPEQYRRFVLEFADGGAGPAYGVHSLRSSPEKKPQFERSVTELAKEFVPPKSLSASERMGLKVAPGALQIADFGGGGAYYLILTGPERGFVWMKSTEMLWFPEVREEPDTDEDTDEEDEIVALLKTRASNKLQFVEWYARWVEDSIAEATSSAAQWAKEAAAAAAAAADDEETVEDEELVDDAN